MAKIEVNNVYKIFGTDPIDILAMVKEGSNKRRSFRRNRAHSWIR